MITNQSDDLSHLHNSVSTGTCELSFLFTVIQRHWSIDWCGRRWPRFMDHLL